jgi:hypothetical protein
VEVEPSSVDSLSEFSGSVQRSGTREFHATQTARKSEQWIMALEPLSEMMEAQASGKRVEILIYSGSEVNTCGPQFAQEFGTKRTTERH